jgi:hypothetical protein
MKKVVLALGLSALCFASQAQDAKPAAGKMFLAGSLGFSSAKPETPKSADEADATSKITIAPAFGYFIDDHLAIGGRISFAKSMMKDMEGGTEFGIGAFGRYYSSLNDNGTFQMFGEAALGYASTTPLYAKGTDPSPDPGTAFGIGVAPGFGWYPGKNFGVEFTLPSLIGFTSTKSTKDVNAATNFQIGASTLAQPVSFTVLFFLN